MNFKKIATLILTVVMICTTFITSTITANAATANAKVSEVSKVTIQNVGTGQYLNFDYGTLSNGTYVRVWPWDGSTEELWSIYHVSGSTYRIITYKSSKYCLDVYRGNSKLKAGQKCDIWKTGDDSVAQNLTLYRCDDGSYILRMANNSNLALAATASKDRVKLATFNASSKSQKWIFKDANGNKIDIAMGNASTSSAYAPTQNKSLKFVKSLTSNYKTNITTQSWGSYFSGNGYHLGVDLGTSGNNSTTVGSIADGVVYKVLKESKSGGWGNFVIVKHTLPNGKVFYSGYAHLKSMSVKEGQTVNVGTKLGMMGSTGYSTGPHLHLVVFTGSFSKSSLPKGYVSKKIYGDSYTTSGLTYYNPTKVISSQGSIIK